MASVVLNMLELKSRRISLDHCRQLVPMAAFMGITTDEPAATVGIGLIEESRRAQFWRVKEVPPIVAVWRGMQILDRVTDVKFGTYYNAFWAAQRHEDEKVRRALDELREELPDIDEMRRELLRTPVPEMMLDSMLEMCYLPEIGIEVAVWELQEELEMRLIGWTDTVRRVFDLHNRKWTYGHRREHSDR